MLLVELRQGFPDLPVLVRMGLGLGICVFRICPVILVWGPQF